MKSDQVIPERGAGAAQPELQPADLRDASVDAPHGLDEVRIPQDRELWTSLEAAAYLRFETLEAFYSWVHKHRVPRERRGKTALYRRRDLDEVLRHDARRVVGKRQFFSTAHDRRSA
jgi:hypothetical protein